MNGGTLISEGILWRPKLGIAQIYLAVSQLKLDPDGPRLALVLNPADELSPEDKEDLWNNTNVGVTYDRDVPAGNVWCPGRSVL